MVVDTAGVEAEVPTNGWVEIGIFDGNRSGESLNLQKHRITSAQQTITITVPRKPARAGIDPNNLLIDWETDDNVRAVKVKR